jgi:hypothetical protein
MSMKSGRGRLSSTNSLTEKILRNCPCEYAVWSPSCQSPTCQSPAVNRPFPDFESIAWYAAINEICSQSRPERPIASCATISVIIGRIPDGDKHRFVNYDFPFPKPEGPRLNSIETGNETRRKRLFETLKRHPPRHADRGLKVPTTSLGLG